MVIGGVSTTCSDEHVFGMKIAVLWLLEWTGMEWNGTSRWKKSGGKSGQLLRTRGGLQVTARALSEGFLCDFRFCWLLIFLLIFFFFFFLFGLFVPKEILRLYSFIVGCILDQKLNSPVGENTAKR